LLFDVTARIKMRGFSSLYCNECVIHNCETNSELVKTFSRLDLLENLADDPTFLDFSHNYLGDRNVAALCVVLSTMMGVKGVALRGMDLQLDAVTAICKLVVSHRAITSVDLRGNQLFASSGRELVSMLKRNTRVTQLLFDADDMPERIRSAIRVQLGRNVSAAFPCVPVAPTPPAVNSTDESVLQATDVLAVIDVELSQSTAFAEQLCIELDDNRDAMMRCFGRCGLFACQLFADFGPSILPLLEASLDCFNPASQRQIFSTEPVEEVAKAVFTDEVDRLEKNSVVTEMTEGLLLREQIESCKDHSQSLTSCRGPDLVEVAGLMNHLRQSLGILLAPQLKHIDDEIAELRAVIVDKLLVKTRQLVLLRDRVNYFNMDHPEMPGHCTANYRACQQPLRQTWSTVVQETLFVAQTPFALTRRALLQEFHALMPSSVMGFLLGTLIHSCLDHCVGVPMTHAMSAFATAPHTEAGAPDFDWCSVVATECKDAAAVRAMLLRYGACQRYLTLIDKPRSPCH
jgi:hypothetical protein